MKPNIEKALDDKTVQNTIEVIRDRVDSLGVSEPIIQQYGLGDNQILVELPGISDLDRVKSIISSPRRACPFMPSLAVHTPDEQAALAERWRKLFPAIKNLFTAPDQWPQASDADSVYVLQRVVPSLQAPISGLPIRAPIPTPASGTVHFTPTNEAGDKFYEYTSANVGHSMAVVLGGRVKEVANIESAIRDSGEIRGSFSTR